MIGARDDPPTINVPVNHVRRDALLLDAPSGKDSVGIRGRRDEIARSLMHLSRSQPDFRRFCVLLTVALFCGFAVHVAEAQNSKKRAVPTPKPPAAPDASPAPAGTPYVVADPAATVDGEPLSKAELERVTDALLQSNGRALKDLSPADQRRAFQSVVGDMIVDRLLARASAGEKIPDMGIETQYNVLRNQYPTPEAFDAELKKSGQTPEQVRSNIRLQLAQRQWIEHQIADQIKVTPEEVEKFYKEGPPSKFDSPELVRASQILVSVQSTAPPEEALAAEKKINALADRIKKGEPFEAVAKEASDDPTAKTNGGDMNYFTRDRIMPEIADAAFKLKTGEVSAPVRTQFGYHLIKVTDHKPAHTAAFDDDTKSQITAYLQEEKRKDALAALIKSLRDNAKVEIFLP